MLTKCPKGTKDILPEEAYKWDYLEGEMSEICKLFGYKRIRTPVFEHTELFQRGVGDGTDIVQKEMYTFEDKGGRSITLRPEGTAGAARSFIEHGMASRPLPVKLFYFITAYRYEKSQKGRFREHNQFGVEAFGSQGPSIDVEIISILKMLFDRLGVKDVLLKINSLGCSECKGKYIEQFKKYISTKIEQMCETCNTRYEKNTLRILDCKCPGCQEQIEKAPEIIDFLCDDCKAHFEGLKEGLKNLDIEFLVDSKIVRGQDYYTKTVFEFVSENVGTQGTICGGGRYDGLIETCGGKPTPGIGFGLGFERLLMELESREISIPSTAEPDIYIATIGENANRFANSLVYNLREAGIIAEKDHCDRGLKSQMKYADKEMFRYVVVVGDDEISSNKAVLKNMRNGEQKEISLDSLVDRLK
jgi:histidyl-tRNA synthetase